MRQQGRPAKPFLERKGGFEIRMKNGEINDVELAASKLHETRNDFVAKTIRQRTELVLELRPGEPCPFLQDWQCEALNPVKRLNRPERYACLDPLYAQFCPRRRKANVEILLMADAKRVEEAKKVEVEATS